MQRLDIFIKNIECIVSTDRESITPSDDVTLYRAYDVNIDSTYFMFYGEHKTALHIKGCIARRSIGDKAYWKGHVMDGRTNKSLVFFKMNNYKSALTALQNYLIRFGKGEGTTYDQKNYY